MAFNMRAIFAVAIPTVAALLSLLWFKGRKKDQPPKSRAIKEKKDVAAPETKSEETAQNLSNHNNAVHYMEQVSVGVKEPPLEEVKGRTELLDAEETHKPLESHATKVDAKITPEISATVSAPVNHKRISPPKEEDAGRGLIAVDQHVEVARQEIPLEASDDGSQLDGVAQEQVPEVEEVIESMAAAPVLNEAPNQHGPSMAITPKQQATLNCNQENTPPVLQATASVEEIPPSIKEAEIHPEMNLACSNEKQKEDSLSKESSPLEENSSPVEETPLKDTHITPKESEAPNQPAINQTLTIITDEQVRGGPSDLTNQYQDNISNIITADVNSNSMANSAQSSDSLNALSPDSLNMDSSSTLTNCSNSPHEQTPDSLDNDEQSKTTDQCGAVAAPPVDSPTERMMNSSVASSNSNSDSNSEVSNDSGKGASVSETVSESQPSPVVEKEVTVYEMQFPTQLCGRLIGKAGRNISFLKSRSGAHISIKRMPYMDDFQIVVIEGLSEEIDAALELIRKKFPKHAFPDLDLSQINLPLPTAPVLVPEIMQLNLPEGVSCDVIVSSIVDAGHLFVQQPTHPTFSSLERLNHFMVSCYMQDDIVPQLPRPIEGGVICAAPMLGGWYRAQVVCTYEDTDECDIKYVDYGGYARVQACVLRQIRSDFTTLPFQAVECYMANITPLKEEVGGFSLEAGAVLEELTQGRILQSQIIGRAPDGVPFIQLFALGHNTIFGGLPMIDLSQSNGTEFVNRELVSRGVVRWMEPEETPAVEAYGPTETAAPVAEVKAES